MINVNEKQAFEILKSGRNICLGGPAGSGKTYLASKFARLSKKVIALTATTGIAALNIKGETIHKFLKLGINTRPEAAEKIINKWIKIKSSSKPWDKCAWRLIENIDTIIIDEASMLRRDQFELIDVVLSAILDDHRPFGGVQIVLVGDFYQLPPVVSGYDLARFKDLKQPYCFQSYLWSNAGFVSLNLTTSYRQSDPEFLEALNKIRIGKVDDKTDQLMGGRAHIILNDSPVKLFPLKVDVAKENIESLKALNEEIYMSEAEYRGKDYDVDALKKECPADDKLYFCKNAQIMMLTNDFENKWVNGSIGIIREVDPVVIELYNGNKIKPEMNTWGKIEYKIKLDKLTTETIAEMVQYPFKLSWSSSIHKSQGLTLDCVELDLTNCFGPGMAYVALSRVKELSGLKLIGWDKNTVKVDPIVRKFYESY